MVMRLKEKEAKAYIPTTSRTLARDYTSLGIELEKAFEQL